MKRATLRKLRWKIHKWMPTRHKLRRRFRERCDSCGHHARWTESWHTYGNRDGKVWHGPCIALEQWRDTATERLAILDLICEVWDVDSRAVQNIAELRGPTDASGGREANKAWRVMYALDKRRGGEQR